MATSDNDAATLKRVDECLQLLEAATSAVSPTEGA